MPKKKMLTTREALEALKGRGVEVSYSNLALWVRTGRFAGAVQEDTPRGPVWYIPEAAVEKFQPPALGRPPAKKATKKGEDKK